VVVILAVAVEMDRPGEERVGLELLDLLFEQERVRAQIDKFLAGEDALDDLVDLAVQQSQARTLERQTTSLQTFR